MPFSLASLSKSSSQSNTFTDECANPALSRVMMASALTLSAAWNTNASSRSKRATGYVVIVLGIRCVYMQHLFQGGHGVLGIFR